MKRVVLSLLTALPFLSAAAHGQAIVSAIRKASLTAGVEYSNLNPDFGPSRLSAAGVYADLDLNNGLGAEGELRFLRFNSYYGENEDNYLIGPRYTVLHRGPFRPYVKVLVGAGHINFPFDIGYGSYFAIEPAGGVDVLLNRHWRVRGEFDYQYWPSAPENVFVANPPALKPNGFSAGVAYRFF